LAKLIGDFVQHEAGALVPLEVVGVEDDGLTGIAMVQQQINVEFPELVVGKLG
jgi:hypothetical protein